MTNDMKNERWKQVIKNIPFFSPLNANFLAPQSWLGVPHQIIGDPKGRLFAAKIKKFAHQGKHLEEWPVKLNGSSKRNSISTKFLSTA